MHQSCPQHSQHPLALRLMLVQLPCCLGPVEILVSLVEDYDDYANSPCMPSLNRGCLAVVLGMFELQRNESRTANVLPSVHCKL